MACMLDNDESCTRGKNMCCLVCMTSGLKDCDNATAPCDYVDEYCFAEECIFWKKEDKVNDEG